MRARRGVLKLLAVAAAGAVLASCASLTGPRQVDIPLSRLQAGLDRRFPLDNHALEMFDVHLSRPRLSILSDEDRVGLTLEAEISPPFLKRPFYGSVALSGRLYVDPSRSAVFMTDARVDRFDLDGIDGNTSRQLAKVANVVMDKVVREVPVYSFKMDDLRYAGVQFVPTRIATTDSGLVVTLEPVK